MSRFCIVFFSLWLSGCAPSPVSNAGEYPQRLSDWGLLQITGHRFQANGESTVYDLNSPLFSDYAHKYRSVWTPPKQEGTVSRDGTLRLPVGSVVTKTFYYSKQDGQLVHARVEDVHAAGLNLNKVRLIETRVLVHTEAGWQGLPYIWNKAQTEATLEITGELIPLQVLGLGEFNYVVPDFNQCQGCHVTNVAKGDMQLIGLKAKHLDKPYGHSEQGLNQLVYLAERHALLDLEAAEYQVNADWQALDLPLETAARSYLDINCGHCHSRTGAADTSAMFLTMEETDPIHLGVCKPPVAAGQGTGGHLFGINPGHGQESIMTFRMQSDDPGAMMPELGRTLVHVEGVQLIIDWIDNIAGNCG